MPTANKTPQSPADSLNTLYAYKQDCEKIRVEHGWKRDGRPLSDCVSERIYGLYDEIDALVGVLKEVVAACEEESCVTVLPRSVYDAIHDAESKPRAK